MKNVYVPEKQQISPFLRRWRKKLADTLILSRESFSFASQEVHIVYTWLRDMTQQPYKHITYLHRNTSCLLYSSCRHKLADQKTRKTLERGDFRLLHYAGEVTYCVVGKRSKNFCKLKMYSCIKMPLKELIKV